MKPRKPMPPGKPLERKTPLARTGGPTKARKVCTVDDCTRTVWAKDRCSMHYKRAQRAGETTPADERTARAAVKQRSGSWCEVCGAAPAREYQHRKAKVHCTKAELWDPVNAIHVCGHGNLDGCHGRIHSAPTEAYTNGWSVRSGFDPASYPCLRRGAYVWLRADGSFDEVEPDMLAAWLGGVA